VLGRFLGSNFKVTPMVERIDVGVRGLKVLLAINEAYTLTNCSRNTGCVQQSFLFDSRQGLGSPLLKSVQIGSGVQAASYPRVAGVCFPVIKQPVREADHLSPLVQNLQ
jgi:hypothetical protein